MRFLLSLFFLLITLSVSAQTVLTIEGQSYTSSEQTWMGVNIARSVPTDLTFRNNSITSVNTYGYMLQAGDEGLASTNNNLDGAIITGNKFSWSGTDMKSITHGLFTGQNINTVIKYNYLDHVPMGIIRKSANNMSNTSGGVAYNIVKSGAVGINIKGMSNVNVFNNTLYTDRTTSETWRGLIYIYTHIDVTPHSVSHGTKIYNNIFYTKHQTYCIQIDDEESATGLESDYNIFYCENGSPLFYYCGSVKTFSEWQALGYDTHSKVVNPNFKDFANFVPAARLDYGTNLGTAWAEGLSVNAKWGTTDPEMATQNGTWQVGAIIYKELIAVTDPPNQPPAISISSPTKSEAFVAPATITIDAAASDADGSVTKVEFYNGAVKLGERTSSPFLFTWKDVPEGTYSITAAATDNANSRTVSAAVTVVVEKATPAVNQLPSVSISSPGHNSSFEAPAVVTLTAEASDPDGTIVKVEYFSGTEKIGESLSAPWSFSINLEKEGTYEITAAATDNRNAVTVSNPVTVVVTREPSRYPDLISLFPNPNNGQFSFEINPGAEIEPTNLAIVSLTGTTVYKEMITDEDISRELDLSFAPPGNYLIMITDHDRVLTVKQFVKY